MEEPILKIDDNTNKSIEFQKSQIYKSGISEQDANTTIDSVPIKRGCCKSFCYCLFCCCCCHKKENVTKEGYRKNWNKFLKKENNNESIDIPFRILTNLYANENVIEDLEKVRLNPNLVSEVNIRNDLEFYIPQLCTFLLFGETKVIEEYFVFLCKVCNASFFFAHRIHWFLASMVNAVEESKKEEIINIIKMISTLFKSEAVNKNSTLRNFYLAGSEDFINFIQENNFNCFYNTNGINNIDKVNEEKYTEEQKVIIHKYQHSRKMIDEFCDKEMAEEISKEKGIETGDSLILPPDEKIKKLKPDEFFIGISNYHLVNKQDFFSDDNQNQDGFDDNFIKGSSKTFVEDINFISYRSSINFIDHLCEISNNMGELPIEQQREYLNGELKLINKQLPCNVYLPFLKESTRNYLICHIPISGAKIFRTKTRAPIMLTFELIRLNEITNKMKKGNEHLASLRSKSFSGNKINKSMNIEPGFLLDEDELISKPIMVGSPRKKSEQNQLPQKNEYSLLHEDNDKFNTILIKFIQVKQGIPYRRELSKTIYIPHDSMVNTNTGIKPNLLEVIEHSEQRAATQFEPVLKISKEIDDIKEGEDLPEITINNANTEIDMIQLRSIFGEKMHDYHMRLKEKSIFGDLESHKIFKAIIKTNEDLRQEQFATQLINEFYQIFRLSNVKCWLNTYEIISTGNNSGLIEMVPDSLSFDQLKQKTHGMSLHDFFLYYFGQGNKKSKEYKKAMKNYVRSLAGYSLVCYFLQIKDRHNGNILLDAEGHIIHIDFGFLLSNAPGKGLKFETAPFKLTKDMVDCMGGITSEYYKKYVKHLKKGFEAISKHRNKIIILVEMMWCGHGKNLPCFEGKQEAIDELKRRLLPDKNMKSKEMNTFVETLIYESYDNWRTKFYDYFQYKSQGIYY